MGYIGLINGLIVLIKKKAMFQGLGLEKGKKKKRKRGGGGPSKKPLVVWLWFSTSCSSPIIIQPQNTTNTEVVIVYTHTHNLTLVAEKVHSQQFLPAGKAQAISAPLPDCLIILPPPPWIQRAWVSISWPDSSCVCFFLLYRASKKRPLSLYSPSLYQAVTDIILCRTFSQWDLTVCLCVFLALYTKEYHICTMYYNRNGFLQLADPLNLWQELSLLFHSQRNPAKHASMTRTAHNGCNGHFLFCRS